VYHALNRATARLKLFRKAADYAAFLRVLDEALARQPVRLVGYCLMPTHWHFVLWPSADRERNPLRAGLVRRAEEWPWSSLACRLAGDDGAVGRLQAAPVALPPNWLEGVNQPQTEAELEALRRSVARGCPYGPEAWVQTVVQRLGLQSTIRPRGRPRKQATEPRDTA
jgi:putative transposase